MEVTEVDGPQPSEIRRVLLAEGIALADAPYSADERISVMSSPERVGEILWRNGIQVSLLHRKPVESLESFYSELTSPEFAAVSRTEEGK